MRRLIAVVLCATLVGCAISPGLEATYQADADKVRALYLLEWLKCLLSFETKSGRYPLQDRLRPGEVILVQIATREQQAYLDPKDPKYLRAIDNKGPAFTNVSVKEFVADIERSIGRIEERYDPQRVPYGGPNYFSYIVNEKGFVIWVPCQTCGPETTFATRLWTGTSAISVASPGYEGRLDNAQSFRSLIENKAFIAFYGKGPSRTGWFAQLQGAQVDESKH
jgi:hypothetical protein